MARTTNSGRDVLRRATVVTAGAVLLGATLLAASVAGPHGSVQAQRPEPLSRDSTEIEVLHVQGNVYMVANAGSNITLHVGDEGALVIDPSLTAVSAQVLDAIRQLTDQPIRYLVNTGVDLIHIEANAVFAAAGEPFGELDAFIPRATPIIGHENGVIRLSAASGTPEAVPFELWPTQTFFGAKKTMFFNGESIEMLHVPEAHSDGNILVYFRGSDVISAGDAYVTSSYPVINRLQGGSVHGAIDALNTIIDITIPAYNQQGGTLVIPGHGRISNESDVVQVRDMLTIVRDRIQVMVDKGMALDEVEAARPTLDYDGIYGWDSGPWTTSMFIEAIYDDLNDTERARDLP